MHYKVKKLKLLKILATIVKKYSTASILLHAVVLVLYLFLANVQHTKIPVYLYTR